MIKSAPMVADEDCVSIPSDHEPDTTTNATTSTDTGEADIMIVDDADLVRPSSSPSSL